MNSCTAVLYHPAFASQTKPSPATSKPSSLQRRENVWKDGLRTAPALVGADGLKTAFQPVSGTMSKSNETTRPLRSVYPPSLPTIGRWWDAEPRLEYSFIDPAGSAVGTAVELRPRDSPVGHKILRPPTSRSPSSLRAPTQTPDTLTYPFDSIRTRHLPANAGT